MEDVPEEFRDWLGRRELVTDGLAPEQATAVAAMLDRLEQPTEREDQLPPLWQWCYFLPRAAQSRLGEDGHPERGGFLPPIPYPRRMFAGARLRFHTPLRLGATAEREGEIRAIRFKEGRSGRLAFVTVGYTYRQGRTVCIEEEQDIVYREPGAPVEAPPVVRLPDPPAGAWTRTVVPDSRLLFRFSALTFNAHRIHYDREYAKREEGYPALVVHGPLTAMLLAQLVRDHVVQPITAFRFKGLAPLFDHAPFRLVAQRDDDGVALRAEGPDGRPTLEAHVTLG